MGVTHRRTAGTMVFGLALLLLSGSYAAMAEQAQAEQKTSEQLLLEIVDLHSRLVTNDVFLAQAKMLGAYLESAQPMEESKKAAIYRSVLRMMERIKEAGIQVSVTSTQEKAKPEQKSHEDEQKDRSFYVPGAALLEIFKADSIANIPRLPIIGTYWERDLACTGGFLVPGRGSEIGRNSPYVARFSFYYEAKESGDYGFTLIRPDANGVYRAQNLYASKITVGDADIVKTGKELSAQGVCTLGKGFHKVEFWLVTVMPNYFDPADDRLGNRHLGEYASFGVKVLVPGELDAVPLTKDMMLLRADQRKSPQDGQPKSTTRQAVPYVDY